MDSWQGIGPDHFYTTGIHITAGRVSVVVFGGSQIFRLTGISNRVLARLEGITHRITHPRVLLQATFAKLPPDGGAAYCSGAGKILILSKSCAEGTANTRWRSRSTAVRRSEGAAATPATPCKGSLSRLPARVDRAR